METAVASNGTSGFLLVNKPAGISSFGVVARVRRVLRQAQSSEPLAQSKKTKLPALSPAPSASLPKIRVGHTGTLDPAATGLMILVIGGYTKRAAEFSKMDKTYEVELTLGQESTTGDIEGKITSYEPFSSEKKRRSSKKLGVSRQRIEEVLESFVGQISQTPPIYSAIKVNGQRAYKLARAGKTPRLEPRQVKVYSIQLTAYNYPKLSFITEVSSGTYIRSLAVDIGQELGTGAYMSALKRTKIANYKLADAIELEPLDAKIIQDHTQHL